MSFIESLKNLFTKHAADKLPQDMNSVEELKAKAQDVLEQNQDAIQQVTDKIPGEADDQLVEKVQDNLK